MSGATPQHFEVGNDPLRLDLFLARETGESRMFVKFQVEHGHVTVNGNAITKAAHLVRPGDRVETRFQEEQRLELVPRKGDLEVLFEDEFLMVLNKPQGMVVHPAAGTRGETLVHFLLYHLHNHPDFTATSATRPGIVHRLDRGTSGLILVAKDRRTLEHLCAQFKAREVEKEYEAIAWGKATVAQGTFQSEIGRHATNRKRMASVNSGGREALTAFAVKRSFGNFFVVRLFPKTGRTHQLRVHLSENRHPIAGDSLYGGRSLAKRTQKLPAPLREALETVKYPFLHAAKISFTHPVSKERLSFEAPLPATFDNFLRLLESCDP